jgi:prophage regulatory protein
MTQDSFVRLTQIIGNLSANPPIQPLIPISRSGWWAGVRAGHYPQPIKLGRRTTVWRRSDIDALIANGIPNAKR